MEYIIKKGKLKRILKSYIGDLEESKYYYNNYGDYFKSWVNSKGNTVFIFDKNYNSDVNDERIGIDTSFFRSLEKFISAGNMSEDSYNIFTEALIEIANDVVGTNIPSLLLYNLNE